MTGFRKVKTKLVLLVLLHACLFISTESYASLQKNLWPQWEVTNPLSTAVISHKTWNDFLKCHVLTNEEGINLLNYASFSKEDLNAIQQYIQEMAAIDITTYNRREQLAYWINVFNALTIQTVASFYPISDIKEINLSPGLFSKGPWEGTLIHIKNAPLSLDDINNRIIRPIWNDPRTHYALTDATLGAPNIANHAYDGAHIEEQLNEAATAYINSLRGVQVVEGKLFVSQLYDWYEEDFGGSKQLVIQHLIEFAKEPLLGQLKKVSTIDSYMYNWHVNSPADLNA